jgi:hypothetical protein
MSGNSTSNRPAGLRYEEIHGAIVVALGDMSG